MSAFKDPLQIALVMFPIIAFFSVIPYMIFQYRKHGSVSTFRTLVIFSFIYYLLNAYFLVILPLPDRASVNTTYREMMQLRPFQFIFDLVDKSTFRLFDPNTYIHALTQPVFTQLVFNVLLTVPFGFYMRYYFKKNLKETLLLSTLLSLFFEISQLSGLFFIYPGPYRLFDVDDLLLNTLGGFVGYLTVPFFAAFLPSRESIDESSQLKAHTVSLIKRAVVYFIDITIIALFVYIINLFVPDKFSTLINFILFMFYFTFVPLVQEGQTWGQKFLKVKLVDKKTNEDVTLNQLLIRSFLLFVFVYSNVNTLGFIGDLVIIFESRLYAIIYIVTLGLWFVFYGLYWLYVLIKRPQQLFYDKLTHSKFISTFK